MSKTYIDKRDLEVIFDLQFSKQTWEFFDEWLDRMIEEGKVELVEFNYYEVSKLDINW